MSARIPIGALYAARLADIAARLIRDGHALRAATVLAGLGVDEDRDTFVETLRSAGFTADEVAAEVQAITKPPKITNGSARHARVDEIHAERLRSGRDQGDVSGKRFADMLRQWGYNYEQIVAEEAKITKGKR